MKKNPKQIAAIVALVAIAVLIIAFIISEIRKNLNIDIKIKAPGLNRRL